MKEQVEIGEVENKDDDDMYGNDQKYGKGMELGESFFAILVGGTGGESPGK